MSKKRIFFYLSISLLLCALVFSPGSVQAIIVDPYPASGNGVTPVLVDNNPKCEDLGFPGEVYFEGNYNTTKDGVTISTTSVDMGELLDWTSTFGIDAVIMKGGDNANVYYYNEGLGDTNLHTPINPSGKYAGISHVTFCYDYELDVDKGADTTFTRTYEWSIKKSVDPKVWNLFTGDSGTSKYTVSVTKTGYTDSDWAVSGSITIYNPAPFAATIESVVDAISGFGGVTVDCGVTFPYSLAAGATLTCSYATSLPDGSSRVNTATVTTSGDVGGGEATAEVVFGTPTTTVNDSIHVVDNFGYNWETSESASWSYYRTFTCDADEGIMYNTATITETGQNDSAAVTVNCHALTVTKDADTALTRTWDWTIDKTADQSALTLSIGQMFLVNYSVTVDATYIDSGWAVSGNIAVYNPAPIAATLNSVADVVSPDIAASVNCGVTFPYSLAAGGTLNCTYSTALPDTESRINTATATLQNYSYDHLMNATPTGTTDFSGTAAVDFSNPTITEVDECIAVYDTYAGIFGTVCYTDLPRTFNYNRWIGPYYECGTYTVENTASFTTNDTGASGSDAWTIYVDVPCAGCTLTPGYWKTHSEFGPAPYDETWALLPSGASTPFYLSGQTYYEVLWTAPKGGNAYYILAHAYIAAKLNFLNGASSTPEVEAAISWAEGFFNANLPSTKLSRSVRNWAIYYAGLLDQYNNGYIGPGHCSE